ncbi:MAG TPA: hypothetical protein VGB74_15560 [Actinoplanes sp.]
MTLDSAGVGEPPRFVDEPTDPIGFPPVEAVRYWSLDDLFVYDGIPTTGNGVDMAYPLTEPAPPSPEEHPAPPVLASGRSWTLPKCRRKVPRPPADSGPPADPRPPAAPADPRPPGAPADPRPPADPGAPADPGPPVDRRARRRKQWAAVGAIVFLGGMAAAILLVPRSDQDRPGEPVAQSVERQGDTSVTGPVNGRTEAIFDLVDDIDSIAVRAGDLGDDLYRISTTGGGVRPLAENDQGGVRLSLSSGGPAAVEVVLNTAVRWTLRLDAGVKQARLDLTGTGVNAVDLGGGAKLIDLTLPAPLGVLPVRMSGGVDQFKVRLAAATPVRVRVQSGAGQVTLGGSTYRGIAPGKSFTAYGWGPGTPGIDLEAVAGMAALTVTNS